MYWLMGNKCTILMMLYLSTLLYIQGAAYCKNGSHLNRSAPLAKLPAKYDDTDIQLIKIGNDAFRSGNTELAAQKYQEAIAILDKIPHSQKKLAQALVKYANSGLREEDSDNWSNYRGLCERAKKIMDSAQSKDKNKANDPTYLLAEIDLEKIRMWQDDDFKCTAAFSCCNHQFTQNVSFIPVISEALSITTESCLKRNKLTEAENYAKRCIDAMRLAGNPSGRIRAFIELANIQMRLGKYSEAQAFCKDAIDYTKSIYGDNNLQLADFLELQGIMQKKAGNENDAAQSWVAELTIRNKHPDERQTLHFLEGAPNCEHFFRDGNVYEKIVTSNATAEVFFIPCEDCLRYDLHLINSGCDSVDLLPENVKLFVSRDADRVDKLYEPKQIFIDRFKDKALVPNTINPGADIAGIICFEHDKTVHISKLEIVFGKTTFSFH